MRHLQLPPLVDTSRSSARARRRAGRAFAFVRELGVAPGLTRRYCVAGRILCASTKGRSSSAMRDKRYLLTRRWSNYVRTDSSFFQRTDPAGFKSLDDHARKMDASIKPIFSGWFAVLMSTYVALIVAMLVYAIIGGPRRPPREARDAAARERAAAFVRALGFEPGPAVCRAKRDGSAWCTIRVAGSVKTFALWCSDEHPNCIENLPRE
jgi:hypothetical protein